MALTVKDLRDALEGLSDDMPVVLQKDAEGNGYSPLAEADQAMYAAETTWYGECYPTPEELDAPNSPYFEEDGPPDGAVRCLLLGPVN